MTTILDRTARVDERGERLYFNVPGEVCVDVCSGREEDRKVVLTFLAQAQEMASLLRKIRDALSESGASNQSVEYITSVLRAAGVEAT